MSDKSKYVPDAKKLLNTFFNPLALTADSHYSLTRGESPKIDALGHAGALALGYGGAAALLRAFMNDVKRRDTEKLRERVRSHIAAKNPTMSLDPSLTDEEAEKELREAGTEYITKEGKFTLFPEARKEVEKDEEGPGTGLWASAETAHPLALALTVGGAGLGTYLGYKGMGARYDKAEKTDLDKRIARLRNEIDRELLNEYRATRGKTAGKEYGGHAEGGGVVRSKPGVAKRLAHTVGGLYGLYALIVGALGYNFVKKFADKRDPNRKDLEKIRDYTKRQALTRKAPQFLDVTGGRLDETTEPPQLMKRKQVGSTSLKAPVKPADSPAGPVDPNDPVAELLNAS